MTNATTLLKTTALALLGTTLVACGGGGDSPAPTGDPGTQAQALANAQGFWSATPSAGNSATAVILPNGQAWVVYQTGNTVTALGQAVLSVTGGSYSGIGKHYALPGGAVQTFTLGGTLPTANTGSLANSVTLGAGTGSVINWTYSKSYESAATQASVQGSWRGAQGAASLSWDVDGAGKLAGTSSTGCSYSGTLTPNANPVAVFDLTVTESCAGAIKTLSGIATLNAAKTGLSLAYTTAAGAQGGVVVLVRHTVQPS